MPKNGKVVFIGFDAGSSDLVLQWANDGILPTFRSLLSKGLSGFTTGLPGFFVGSTWTSINTGVNPAKHGIHSLKQLKPGTYEIYSRFPGEHSKRDPFWNHLGQAGRKVAILDIPFTKPSNDLNGIQLVEYGAHDAHYGFHTWPPSLAQQVEKRFGPPAFHPINGTCDAQRHPEGFAIFRENLINGIKRKTELTKYFLHQEAWDFFAQVFTEGHCAGHQCWHLHDPNHQWHDPKVAQIVGDPIKDVYLAIDTAIGKILKEIEDNTTVIILLSHGMGPTNVQYGFLSHLLQHLKVAAPARMNTKNFKKCLVWRWLFPILSRGWTRTPQNIRKLLKPLKSAISQWIHSIPPPRGIDRTKGKCFPLHDNPSHAGIRINLVGREPKGKVQPGPEYQNFCAELEKDLLAIRNVRTGKPVVSRVIRTAEHYTGENLGDLPDLLVEWNQEDPIPAVFSDKIGKVPSKFWHPRTGHHRQGGLFIALGPSVQPGFLDRTVSIMDFAPTIATLLDVKLPEVDGQPIEELLGLPIHS